MDATTSRRALVFDALDDQIAVLDADGVILDVNAAWTRFGAENGLAAEYQFLGRNYVDTLLEAAARDEVVRGAALGISEVLSDHRDRFYYEYPCHSPDERRWFMMRVSRLDGQSRGVAVVTHVNITERKLAEERAEELARHDELTGLANRRRFDEFLRAELRRSQRDGTWVGLAVLDVDHFKQYNDTLGHAAGDGCLARVAEVLRAFTRRPGDLAARLGGDEFAVVLEKADRPRMLLTAEAIRLAVSELGLVVAPAGLVSVSVGVASVGPGVVRTEEELYAAADRALYDAKAAGRNRVA